MKTTFDYIDTKDKLKKAYQELKKEKILAFDLECENNLHHYGAYISLIQISSLKQNYIVDVILVPEIEEIVDILEDPNIEVIFHDVSFDFRILNHQFKCKPKNVFDTQLAAELLGYTQLGLGYLLEENFGFNKEKKYQMADWTKRPLTEEMLQYAIGDTAYSIALKELLEEKLIKLGRIEWAKQGFERFEKQKWELKEMSYLDVKNLRGYSPKELSVLKKLFQLRNNLAKSVDRPVHYIISTKRLVEFAKEPPKSIQEWKDLKGVHSALKRKAYNFYYGIKKAKREEVVLEKKVIKKFSEKDKRLIDKITQIRNKAAADLDIPNHLLMNRDQIHSIVIDKNLRSLLKWQKDAVEKPIKELLK